MPRATEKPWTWLSQPQADREYVALVTYLPVGRWTAMPAFLRHTVRSTRQLTRSEGLLGYALRAAPHRRKFWTLTIWKDDRAIARYVGAQPHRDAMRWLRTSGMAGFSSARWIVSGPTVPPSWRDALDRLMTP